MTYVLSPLVGSGGTRLVDGVETFDPFRVPGARAIIDLRGDTSHADGWAVALLHDDATPHDDAITLVDGRLPDAATENMAARARDQLSDRLGVTVSTRRFGAALLELLLEGRTDGSRWRPLQPSRDGWRRVKCGGLLAELAPVEGGATISETWPTETADISSGQDLSWSEVAGDLAVVAEGSDTVVSRGGGAPNNDDTPVNFGRAEHDLDGADHYTEHEFFLDGGPGQRSAVACVRYDAAADTCYYGFVNTRGGGQLRIYKREAGSNTELADSALTIDGTYLLRQEVDGSDLTLLLDGTEQLSTTDTSITGHTRAGCGVNGGGATGSHHGISFEAADLSGGGLSATVGQAVESSTAQPVATAKTTTVGQASEASTAQPVTAVLGGLEVAVGQAQTTASAQPVTAERAHSVGQAVDTSTAQPVTVGKATTVGQAQSTATAQPVTVERTHAIGQATETDSAQPVTASTANAVTIGQASETSTARAVTTAKTARVGQAAETFEARPVTARRTHTVGQASTAATARAVSHARTVTVGQAAELSQAQAVSTLKRMTVGQAVETSSALSVTAMLGSPAPTPASRTLTVEAEDRTLVVAAETRVLTVATEDRTLRVRG